MENPIFEAGTGSTILNQVHEGMRVCDGNGDDIGTVRKVFLGEASEKMNEPGGDPATRSDPERRDDALVDRLAEAFYVNEPLPEPVRGRMVRSGFIRIDASGLFASDRFALPDQIESVSDDCVRLRLTRDELIKV